MEWVGFEKDEKPRDPLQNIKDAAPQFVTSELPKRLDKSVCKRSEAKYVIEL